MLLFPVRYKITITFLYVEKDKNYPEILNLW